MIYSLSGIIMEKMGHQEQLPKRRGRPPKLRTEEREKKKGKGSKKGE